MKTIRTFCCLLLLALPARAVIEVHNFTGLNIDIPDGSPSGIANVQNFSTTILQLSDVKLSLHVLATPDADPTAFNGDLYVYVSHGSGFSILLNRAGRSGALPFGYDDNGYDIIFDDAAANGDVHGYRTVTTPAPGSPLTGIWQPDGRLTDPNLVLNTDPRSPTARLSSFNTLGAAGDWTLFIADLSGGNEHRLANWSLTLTGTTVPEPGAAALLGFGGLLLAGLRRRSGVR